MPARVLHDTTHSPVGLYQLNNTSDYGEDTSGNSRNLILTNTLVAPGWIGTTAAYSDSPTGTMINNEGDDYWAHQAALSVYGMAFLDMRTSSATRVVLEARDGTFRYWGISLGLQSGVVRYSHHDSGGVDRVFTPSSGYMTPQYWMHVGFTRDAAGTSINMYIDGVNVGQTTLSDPPGAHTPASSFLQFSSGGSVPLLSWASVKIVEQELTGSEMLAEYNKMLGSE